MSKLPDAIRAETALRNGLRALPVPDTSADFEARIYAAMQRLLPWRLRLRQPCSPLSRLRAVPWR